MKKILFSLILTKVFLTMAFSQDVDISSLDTIDKKMIEDQLSNSGDKNSGFQKVDIDVNTKSVSGGEYFGYSYFDKNINFFDNIPTPENYLLGPGDEILISLWGEQNSQESFKINKDGMIFYENIGFITISNMSLSQAEQDLKKIFKKIYSTLEDPQSPTYLKVSLAKLKSINVYFTGEINSPGINLIHPFSDISTAIIQAGGIKRSGSIRKIQLIRKNEIIEEFDFYSFIIDGRNSYSNVKIIDGDVIHIPLVDKRVQISGATTRNGYFEMINTESINDLISYAGGLSVNASSTAIFESIIPINERLNDDFSKTSSNISVNDFNKILLSDGDRILIPSLTEQETKVQVLGRVMSPGFYAADSNLKEILDFAGGFNNPNFKQSILIDKIIIQRKDNNNFYSQNFKVAYEDTENFQLIAGDKITVLENSNFNNLFSVNIVGEVQNPGGYPFLKDKTLSFYIKEAGGLTELADSNSIIVSENVQVVNIDGNVGISSKTINDVSLDYVVAQNANIQILKRENFVQTVGNIYQPGIVSYKKRNSVKDYITLSGGLKKDTMRRKIYVQSKSGKVTTMNPVKIRFYRPNPGDKIIIPANDKPRDLDFTTFISELSSTLANLAAILILIDNQSN